MHWIDMCEQKLLKRFAALFEGIQRGLAYMLHAEHVRLG
jgi:hypothetical protein